MDLSQTDFDEGNSTINNITDMPPDQTPHFYQIKEVLFMFEYISLPIILVIGLFGNFMTIVTMMSRQFNRLTSRYILIALAISDTTLLLTQPFNKLWIIDLFGTDIRAAFSHLGCKIFFHIFKTGKMTSSWLIVLLCFERFIAVVFPLQAKFILRKKVIITAIVLDYLVIGTYNALMSFSSGVDGGVCKPDLPSPAFKYFIIGACILYSFLPTAILLVLTPQILFRILRHIRMHRVMTLEKRLSTASRKEDEMIRASIMVVGVMIAFIVLVLPIAVVHLYAFLTKVSAFDQNSFGFFIFREISQILEQVNYAINFFIYVLYSSTFKRRVDELLCFSCCFGTQTDKNRMLIEISSLKLSYGSYKISPVCLELSSGSESRNSSTKSSSVTSLSDVNLKTDEPRLMLFRKTSFSQLPKRNIHVF